MLDNQVNQFTGLPAGTGNDHGLTRVIVNPVGPDRLPEGARPPSGHGQQKGKDRNQKRKLPYGSMESKWIHNTCISLL
jgi:hypothetical protein